MKQVWQAEDGKTFDSEEECIIYENNINPRESWGFVNGKECFSEEERTAAIDNLCLLRQKWIEQNDVKKLFGKENKSELARTIIHCFSEDITLYDHCVEQFGRGYYSQEVHDRVAKIKENPDSNYLDQDMENKIIFRSIDNQYFITLEDCKIHEEKIKDEDLTKIIDKERIWRSSYCVFFKTQEECLLFERTANDGKIFDTPEEKNKYDEEMAYLEYQDSLETEGLSLMGEIKKKKQDRNIYGVNWGDEDYSLNEEREEMEEEEYWNRIDGTPN